MYDVSESEMRWQIYTSLAIGAKGVLYFCYWSPVADSTFLRGQAIMTPRIAPGSSAKPTIADQVPSQKYAIVKRLNAKLRVLGDCKHSTPVASCRSLSCALCRPAEEGVLSRGAATRCRI